MALKSYHSSGCGRRLSHTMQSRGCLASAEARPRSGASGIEHRAGAMGTTPILGDRSWGQVSGREIAGLLGKV